MSERELFELWCIKDDEFCIHRYDGSDDYSDDYTQCAWMGWQASANRDGYKLVPVETLEEALSWGNCASSESWNDEQREEIDKHYRVIEKAMIGVVE